MHPGLRCACAAPGIVELRGDGATGTALVVGLGGGALPVFLQRVLRMDVGVLGLYSSICPKKTPSACAAPGIMERRRSGAAGAALVVGLGGGALPVFLQRVLRMDVDVVELDAAVVGLARRHFGFADHADSPRLAVRPACPAPNIPVNVAHGTLAHVGGAMQDGVLLCEASIARRLQLLAQQLREGCHDTRPRIFSSHAEPDRIGHAAFGT